MDGHERWARLEAEWLSRPGIEPKKSMQSVGLSGPAGKIFASLVKGRLLVKLPAGRVDHLVAAGVAVRLVAGTRQMKEWALIDVEREQLWDDLVDEAHRFVG